MAATSTGGAPRDLLRRSTSVGKSTHMTMVRLYSTEFRCQICLQVPNIGWIYRCVEDRELIMEQELADGTLEKMDTICDLFEPLIAPKKRGPAERADKLSFFQEVDDETLKSYTAEQLSIILKQRAEAVSVAREKSAAPSPQDPQGASAYFDNLSSFIKGSKGTTQLPWTPARANECQWKVCHKCRPHSAERSYLDLDAIVNNDIPITAAYGFGFHLSNPKGRPVMNAEIVKNLGLRLNPPVREESSTFSTRDHSFSSFQAPLGLGLFPVDPPLPTIPTLDAPTQILPATSFAYRYGHNGTDPSLQQLESFADAQSSEVIGQAHEPTSAADPFISPGAHDHGYPDDTRDCSPRSALQERLANVVMNVQLETALLTPLPEQTTEEVETTSADFTMMEMEEMADGHFGDGPLRVAGGVAVTEEAVEMHVADLITQF